MTRQACALDPGRKREAVRRTDGKNPRKMAVSARGRGRIPQMSPQTTLRGSRASGAPSGLAGHPGAASCGFPVAWPTLHDALGAGPQQRLHGRVGCDGLVSGAVWQDTIFGLGEATEKQGLKVEQRDFQTHGRFAYPQQTVP